MPELEPMRGFMYISTVSLITLFQARAATKPKPEVARAVICLTITRGKFLVSLSTSIFGIV